MKASGRDGATLPLVLLSPFHHVPAATAASLLMHHMAWHSRLGRWREEGRTMLERY